MLFISHNISEGNICRLAEPISSLKGRQVDLSIIFLHGIS